MRELTLQTFAGQLHHPSVLNLHVQGCNTLITPLATSQPARAVFHGHDSLLRKAAHHFDSGRRIKYQTTGDTIQRGSIYAVTRVYARVPRVDLRLAFGCDSEFQVFTCLAASSNALSKRPSLCAFCRSSRAAHHFFRSLAATPVI